MDMMLMLVILAAIYFTTLTLLCLYHEKLNTKICNATFIVLDVIFYFLWNVGMYESLWLDDIYDTLKNISPMIFTVIPLTCMMNEKVKSYAYSAIAFLWVGMFVALFLSPQNHYVSSFDTEANLVYTGEALCHMLASLFGIYLILTKQVKLDFGAWCKALTFLYIIIWWGVLENVVFHLDHFGMDPYGDYGIYFIDIFNSFGATLVAYLVGVLLVVTLGMQFGQMLHRLVRPKQAELVSLKDHEDSDLDTSHLLEYISMK